MDTGTTRSLLILVTVAAIVLVGWLAVFRANGSLVIAPAPLTLVYPMVWVMMRLEPLGIRSGEAVLIPAVAALYGLLFLGHLVRGARRIPLVSVASFVALVLGNLAFWLWAWRYGVQWQGTSYTVSVAILNVLLVALAGFALVRGRRAESFWANYWFHTILALWVCWVSCPWLGEMP
jgi:hypothetical protein